MHIQIVWREITVKKTKIRPTHLSDSDENVAAPIREHLLRPSPYYSQLCVFQAIKRDKKKGALNERTNEREKKATVKREEKLKYAQSFDS